MKSLQSQGNPTKTQLLLWINQTQPPSLPKINQIGQLGNGVTYLHLLLKMYPGCLRPQKIYKAPSTAYQIRNNLSLLLSTFQKLGLPYKFEVDKIAQMKYQDNFHLISFLFKLEQKDKVKGEDSKSTNKSNKFTVIPPANSKTRPLKKEPPPPITPQTLAEISNPEKQKEELEPIMDKEKEEKVGKIASLLKISQPSDKKEKVPPPPKTCIVEQSYRRILRKTFCDQSKYLNSYPVMNSFKDYSEWNEPHGPEEPENTQNNSKFEESMLLSSNKNDMLLSSQKKREPRNDPQENDREEERQSEGSRKKEEEKGEPETREENGNLQEREQEDRVM